MENLITAANTETIIVDLRSYAVTMIASSSCNEDGCTLVDNHHHVEIDDENGNVLATAAEEGFLSSETSVNDTGLAHEPCNQQEKMTLFKEVAYEGIVEDEPTATVASISEENLKHERITVPDETGGAEDEWKKSMLIAPNKKSGNQELILQNAEENSSEFLTGKGWVGDVEKSSSISTHNCYESDKAFTDAKVKEFVDSRITDDTEGSETKAEQAIEQQQIGLEIQEIMVRVEPDQASRLSKETAEMPCFDINKSFSDVDHMVQQTIPLFQNNTEIKRASLQEIEKDQEKVKIIAAKTRIAEINLCCSEPNRTSKECFFDRQELPKENFMVKMELQDEDRTTAYSSCELIRAIEQGITLEDESEHALKREEDSEKRDNQLASQSQIDIESFEVKIRPERGSDDKQVFTVKNLAEEGFNNTTGTTNEAGCDKHNDSRLYDDTFMEADQPFASHNMAEFDNPFQKARLEERQKDENFPSNSVNRIGSQDSNAEKVEKPPEVFTPTFNAELKDTPNFTGMLKYSEAEPCEAFHDTDVDDYSKEFYTHSTEKTAYESSLFIEKYYNSHLDHLKADEAVLLSMQNQNFSPHFAQSTVAAAVAVKETQNIGNLNKLKENEAHHLFLKAKATRSKDVHLAALEVKKEHAKNDKIASLIADVELLQKKNKVAQNHVRSNSTFKGKRFEKNKLADKGNEPKNTPHYSPRKLQPCNQPKQATKSEFDHLVSKSSTVLLDVEPSPSPESHALFTPESKGEKAVIMNESIRSEEKEAPEFPVHRRLSLPSSHNQSQSSMTPLADRKKRPVSSASKSIMKSNVEICSRKWNSRSVSSPQPCERCLKIHTTARVQKGFEMNIIATSPCVNKTRGGCSPTCGFYPRNISQGEKPVVLCRHCFYAVHRVLEQC